VLAMLVVTCPCAISLAAPAAFATALSALARQGLLLRSTEVFDRLLDIRTWLFDKTGTVTSDDIRVAHTETFGEHDARACLEIAQALEAGIDHPLARAFAAEHPASRATQIEYHTGQGVSGRYDDTDWRLGSAEFAGVTEAASEGGVWLSRNGTTIARFLISEQVRPSAPEAIQMLQGAGMRTALVSGDAESAVRIAADTLSVDDWHAAQRPEQKLELLERLQKEGQRVTAVGDGVNDAPFLAQADVSIALVTGAEIAKASADIVFTGDDLKIVAMLQERAVQVRRTIRQNIGWAIAYNMIGIPLAAGGLLPPWAAALGMSASSLIVVLNGLRLGGLLRSKPPAAPSRRQGATATLVEA
jgi:Cu2+-exporting ATPase